MPLTNSQISKLGDRLRAGPVTDEDLRLLDAFQQEFTPALAETRRLLEEALVSVLGAGASRPTARIKQLRSIIEKLNRMRTRLDQLQDVVGLRVVVPDLRSQDDLVTVLDTGSEWRVRDHRFDAPHGYRAVHAIRKEGRYRVEVQIRTSRQQWWADLVELLDRFVPGLKYGTGPPEAQDAVATLAGQIAAIEAAVAAGDSEEEQRLSRELLFGAAVTAFILSFRSTRPQ